MRLQTELEQQKSLIERTRQAHQKAGVFNRRSLGLCRIYLAHSYKRLVK